MGGAMPLLACARASPPARRWARVDAVGGGTAGRCAGQTWPAGPGCGACAACVGGPVPGGCGATHAEPAVRPGASSPRARGRPVAAARGPGPHACQLAGASPSGAGLARPGPPGGHRRPPRSHPPSRPPGRPSPPRLARRAHRRPTMPGGHRVHGPGGFHAPGGPRPCRRGRAGRGGARPSMAFAAPPRAPSRCRCLRLADLAMPAGVALVYYQYSNAGLTIPWYGWPETPTETKATSKALWS
jgi:hypothetical protein